MKRHYTLSGLLLCLMTLFTLNASALRGGDKTPDKDYLCFTANTDGSTVELTKSKSPAAVTIQYTTDNGASWTDVDFSTATTTGTITLTNAGDKVYFRNAKPASEVTGFSTSATAYYMFTMSGSIAASGNVMSLVDNGCESTSIPGKYCFRYLFNECESLTSAPELPAVTLKQYCYYGMFDRCENMTVAPELPATTLANYCYSDMFGDCYSLEIAPELPAVTLKQNCYQDMFTMCKKLKDIKAAFTNTEARNCLMNWVMYVSQEGTFTCPVGMEDYKPEGWTVKNTYDLAISSETGWASMCVNLPLQVPTGVDVYYASAVDGTTIELTQIAAGTVMAAKTAVIVKGAKGTVGFPIAPKGVTITSFDDNLFQGSSVAKACNAGENYVLNASKSSDDNVHFSIYTGTTLSDHKAYLPMSAVGGASSIQFRFADATAISTVETEVAEDVIYNLAGQRVGSDYRGIVIKNGKKTFNN